MDIFSELKNFINIAHQITASEVVEVERLEFLKRKKMNDRRNKLPEVKVSQKKYEKSEKGKKQKKMRGAWSGVIRRKSSFKEQTYQISLTQNCVNRFF